MRENIVLAMQASRGWLNFLSTGPSSTRSPISYIKHAQHRHPVAPTS
jgi:hypothetical protein